MFARANGSLFVLVRHELAHLSWLGAVRVGGGAQNHDFWELEFPPQIHFLNKALVPTAVRSPTLAHRERLGKHGKSILGPNLSAGTSWTDWAPADIGEAPE